MPPTFRPPTWTMRCSTSSSPASSAGPPAVSRRSICPRPGSPQPIPPIRDRWHGILGPEGLPGPVDPPRCLSAVGRVGMMAAMADNLGEGDPDGLAPAARHALEAFVAHLRDERGLSVNTVAAYRRDMIQFLQFAGRGGVTDPAQVETLLLRRFLALQRTRGLAAASIARKAAALRSGFRFLARRGLVADDPAAGLGVPRGPKRLPVVLKPRQVDRLLAGPDPVDPVGLRDRAILELLYATGIRVGELCGLHLGDVDLAADTVLVLGKGAKERVVPFGEPARAALLDYLANGRAAMVPTPGKPTASAPARRRPGAAAPASDPAGVSGAAEDRSPFSTRPGARG